MIYQGCRTCKKSAKHKNMDDEGMKQDMYVIDIMEIMPICADINSSTGWELDFPLLSLARPFASFFDMRIIHVIWTP